MRGLRPIMDACKLTKTKIRIYSTAILPIPVARQVGEHSCVPVLKGEGGAGYY